MKFSRGGMIMPEEGEPAMRSCWECNPAHEHLKDVGILHVCFACGRYWVKDRFLSSFFDKDIEGNVVNLEEGNKNLVDFLRSHGFEEISQEGD